MDLSKSPPTAALPPFPMCWEMMAREMPILWIPQARAVEAPVYKITTLEARLVSGMPAWLRTGPKTIHYPGATGGGFCGGCILHGRYALGRLEYAFDAYTIALPRGDDALLSEQSTLIGPGSVRLTAPSTVVVKCCHS